MEAADGGEAARVFKENQDRIRFILTDVVMPRRNGKALHEEAATICPNVKAIFTSGYAGDVILTKGLENEAVDFLPKPLTATVPLQKVREVLDR